MVQTTPDAGFILPGWLEKEPNARSIGRWAEVPLVDPANPDQIFRSFQDPEVEAVRVPKTFALTPRLRAFIEALEKECIYIASDDLYSASQPTSQVIAGVCRQLADCSPASRKDLQGLKEFASLLAHEAKNIQHSVHAPNVVIAVATQWVPMDCIMHRDEFENLGLPYSVRSLTSYGRNHGSLIVKAGGIDESIYYDFFNRLGFYLHGVDEAAQQGLSLPAEPFPGAKKLIDVLMEQKLLPSFIQEAAEIFQTDPNETSVFKVSCKKWKGLMHAAHAGNQRRPGLRIQVTA